MNESQGALHSHSDSPAVVRRAVQISIFIAFWAALFFVAAGTLAWWRTWLYLGVSALLLTINFLAVMPTNPQVVIERSRRHAGTTRADRTILFFYSLAIFALPVVAGLDAVRFGWSTMPATWLWPALVLFALGNVPTTWAMRVNPFLERTVRIQTERGHHAIESGPYRWVRHPMYVGILVQQLAAPFILGSRWALLPAAAILVLLITRTAFEDRTLRAELPGYAEYAQRTRFRLLPGVW